MLPDLPDQIGDAHPIGMVTADGVCDTRACRAAIAARQPSSRPARPANRGKNRRQGQRYGKRCPSQLPMPWPGYLAAIDRLSPTKSARGQDTLLQAPGREHHVPRHRQAGRRAADQGRHPDPPHRPRKATHPAHRIDRSRERDTPAFRAFAQQSQ